MTTDNNLLSRSSYIGSDARIAGCSNIIGEIWFSVSRLPSIQQTSNFQTPRSVPISHPR